MIKVILRKKDKSASVSIPWEVCSRLGFEPGEELSVVEEADSLKIIKVHVFPQHLVQASKNVETEPWVDCGK
jgi:hypothetical protein